MGFLMPRNGPQVTSTGQRWTADTRKFEVLFLKNGTEKREIINKIHVYGFSDGKKFLDLRWLLWVKDQGQTQKSQKQYEIKS